MNRNHQTQSETVYSQALKDRREFHRYPETGWTEYKTTAYIWDRLTSLGYKVYTGKDVCKEGSRMGLPSSDILKACEERALSEGVPQDKMNVMKDGFTGIIGVLRNPKAAERKVYALRFDIDALPVEEKTGLDFASCHKGIMHACGHDGHMAAGLAVAGILADHKDALPAEVRLIFQPAEEGCRGAKAITDNGWLDDVDVLLAGHIGINSFRAGEIVACTEGFYATTKLNIRFKGEAAHAAKVPEPGRNALLAAARFVVHSYDYEPRDRHATKLNVGTIRAGSGRNIIADNAYLEVETRGTDSKANEEMAKIVVSEARKAAEETGVFCEIETVGSTGTGSGSSTLIRKLEALAAPDMTYIDHGTFTASEDAVTMMQTVQARGGEAAYYMFGSRLSAEHHAPSFDFEEKSIMVMAEFLASAVLNYRK